MRTIMCTNCKYTFQPRKDIVPRRCPYCSKEASLVDEEEFLGV